MSTRPSSIVITGASTGIGRAIALGMAKDGHQVFAGIRKTSDAQSLRSEAAASRLMPVELDVTDAASVAVASGIIEQARDRDRPLCLVNNAGIALAGPVETLPLPELRRQFEVNVFGLVAVTQAFLPAIRESKGRIVNISSVSGLVTSPFLGAYSASKFAVEALSDALRREVSAHGIKVVLIEPGPIQTPIWEKGLSKTEEVREHGPYADALRTFAKGVKKAAESAIPAEHVVAAVRDALSLDDPPVRKIVTSRRGRLEVEIGRRLPAKWMDKLVTSPLYRFRGGD